MNQIPTTTQVKQALHKLAEQKNRPCYEVCTVKEVKYALENGLDHPLIDELRPLIVDRVIPTEIIYEKNVLSKEQVEKRLYPTKEQEVEIVRWLNESGHQPRYVSKIAGCAEATISMIRKRKNKFSLHMYNKINAARMSLEGVTNHDKEQSQ